MNRIFTQVFRDMLEEMRKEVGKKEWKETYTGEIYHNGEEKC